MSLITIYLALPPIYPRILPYTRKILLIQFDDIVDSTFSLSGHMLSNVTVTIGLELPKY